MTIGKNSRKTSVRSSIRAPKFLDKSSGFYGRLDEPENVEDFKGKEVEQNGTEDNNREGGVTISPTPAMVHNSGADEREEAGAYDFNEGIMEDDGETLLQRKPSRHSNRWRRSSRRKQKEGKGEEDLAQDERPSLGKESPVDLEDTGVIIEVEMEKLRKTEEENEMVGKGREPALVHFPAREDADDQVLIRDKKRGREEEGEEVEEERSVKREQEKGMKVVKRNSMKNYRKALDRAFRRGWEAFITNLYSVTLAPVTSSSPPPPTSEEKNLHKSVLAEFR